MRISPAASFVHCFWYSANYTQVPPVPPLLVILIRHWSQISSRVFLFIDSWSSFTMFLTPVALASSTTHACLLLLLRHPGLLSPLFVVLMFLSYVNGSLTTTESADVALSLFRAQKNHYNLVIANLRMPEMKFSKFVQELHQEQKNIPVILMAENVTTDLAREALGCGVCYLFSKPLSHRDIAILWHHICRVTGKMPSSTDTTCIDIEKYGCCHGAVRNQEQRNSKRKVITTEIENTKRRKNQIADNSNSNDSEEEDGCNSKKSRMTWTYSLHQMFLRAVNILGEQNAQPKTILTMLNEPRLTVRQISSYLQKYRDRKRHSVNRQNASIPVTPTKQPAAPMSIFLPGQTTSTATFDSAVRGAPQIPRSPSWTKPPNFVGYTINDMNEILNALDHSRKDAVNAIISNGDIQEPEGCVGVQIDPSIDANHKNNGNSSADIREQPQVFSHNYVHVTPACGHVISTNDHSIPESGYLSNGLEAPNHERGVTGDVMLSSDHLSNGFQALNQEPARATGDVTPVSGNLSNGLQVLNQESAGDFEIGMCGLGNAGNLTNMNNDNSGEGTSANKEFGGMSIEDSVNQVIEEFEESVAKFWDFD